MNVIFLEPGFRQGWVLFTVTVTGSVDPRARLRVDFDGKHFIWDPEIRRCITSPCVGQFRDPPAEISVEMIQGSTEMVGVLNGQPIVVTVEEGATATITETTVNGVLTNVSVAASGPAGGVVVNGITVPTGETTTVGRLQAKVTLSGGRTKSLNLSGTFTPGASSDGLDPLSEEVYLQVGPYAWRIPVGSFTIAGDGAYSYQATVSGVKLSVQIKRVRGQWTVKLNATPVSGVTLPTSIGLRIGDDVGTTTG